MQMHILALTFATVIWAGHAQGQGNWYEVVPALPENPRHAVLLPPTTFNNTWYPDGLILYLERSGTKAPFLWDPAGQSHVGQTGAPPNTKTFCSGHAFDGFGRLVVAGGWFGPGNCGNEQVALFNPVNLAATPFATQMVDKRFYPSCVTVADGTVWILGGQRWNPTCTQNCCNVRNPDVEWVDIYQGADPVVVKANVSLSPALQNYPVLFMLGTATEGNLMVGAKAPPGVEVGRSYWYNTALPTQNLIEGPQTALSAFHGEAAGRSDASAVLLPVDLRNSPPVEQVLAIGGHALGGVEGTCEILRKNPQGQWVWVFTGDPQQPNDPGNLRHPRANPDCVLLADGTPFLVGGNEESTHGNPIFTPEIFNAANSRWSVLLDSQGQPLNHQYRRAYHSVALLLRDGSVWVAGDDNDPGNNGKQVEIFQPEYMFMPRPQIVWPATEPVLIGRNTTFPVVYTLPQGRSFGYVALIALGSATHSLNFSQRYVILDNQEPSGNSVNVFPPPAAFAPPGPYMMVVADDLGVPSVAEFVYLDF